ncbi:hypothetical protein [Streptomyces canus]|uniref:hypothetical protein n=1 Tax=Streptomyces canus TaxID=58343 RepID=UPI0030DE08B2
MRDLFARGGEQVAGSAVPGDEPQGLLLTAAEHDLRMGRPAVEPGQEQSADCLEGPDRLLVVLRFLIFMAQACSAIRLTAV